MIKLEGGNRLFKRMDLLEALTNEIRDIEQQIHMDGSVLWSYSHHTIRERFSSMLSGSIMNYIMPWHLVSGQLKSVISMVTLCSWIRIMLESVCGCE
jgi:hypothetical protein